MTTVSIYSDQGWQGDLPPLNTGRYDHACASFIFGEKRVIKDKMTINKILVVLLQIYLVTGGDTESRIWTDSTELYDPSLGSWRVTWARLPRPRYGLRAANIDNQILIFGKHIPLT